MRTGSSIRLLTLFLILLVSIATAGAEPILDQQFDPRANAGGAHLPMYRGGYFSQTFTVGVDGRLAGVDVLMSRQASTQIDVLFEISATLDGVPVPPMGLPAHGAIPFAAIPVDPEGSPGAGQDWVRLDVTMHDIMVTRGQVLAIVLKVNSPPGPIPPDKTRCFETAWHASDAGPYAMGAVFAHPAIPGSPWNPIETVDAGFRTWVEPVEVIEVDIRPCKGMGAINPGSNGMLAVALTGDGEFDVAQVDPSSVRVLGVPAPLLPNGRPKAALEDVNGDGFMDLVVHVPMADLDLAGDQVEILVTATTWSGVDLRGSDTVQIVPRRPPGR